MLRSYCKFFDFFNSKEYHNHFTVATHTHKDAKDLSSSSNIKLFL